MLWDPYKIVKYEENFLNGLSRGNKYILYFLPPTFFFKPGLDISHLTDATYNFFGPESEYENQENHGYKVGKEDKISEWEGLYSPISK